MIDKELLVEVRVRDGDVTLANINVPLAPASAWRLFQDAASRVVEPQAIVTFPEGIEPEHAERMIAEFQKRHRRSGERR